MKDEVAHRETPAIDTIPIGGLPASGPGGKVAFRIPAYQRGYRWKKDNVSKLLCDLKEFIKDGDNGEKARPFYCLQPLVVKKAKIKSDDEKTEREVWEVVDGQQRLTTLFLIWKFVDVKLPYELSYETRKQSEKFLNDPKPDESGRFPNIDFHHIYHAYQAILTWFNGDEGKKASFKKLLSDSTSDGRNVRFIWYQLQEDDDAVAAFTRLNVGKIPLRDEELIRALFLSSAGSGKLADGAFQHRLALEWDRIETALQEPDFWGFISNEATPEGGRIRLLFQLCAPEIAKNDNHALFEYYHARLSGEHPDKPSSVWHDIVACFEQLYEWYRDPEHFHLVGYRATILGNGIIKNLRELLNDTKSTTKSDFATKLRQSIRLELIGKTGDASISAFVSGLSYSTSLKTRQTLALFNIATILRTKGVRIRFPFHLYHDTKVGWDIEHIQSQAGDGLGDKKRQIQWLESCRPEIAHDAKSQAISADHNDDSGELSPHTLLAAIDDFLMPDSKEEFPELEKKIRVYFSENDAGEIVDSIGNLTLLDAPTNRSYGNSPFAVKRAEILKSERPEGTFILPCTRDLFLKVFSDKPGNLRRWNILDDGAAHEAAICETIENFFDNRGGSPA